MSKLTFMYTYLPTSVDVEWYLNQQILPPIARLCEPIEGTSTAMLAERLGLDGSKFARKT